MRIQCKCGTAMSVDAARLAGKKVACGQCGQRYRIPPAGGEEAVTTQSDRPDAPAVQPSQAGIVALGQKTSFLWIFIALFITLTITVGGAYGAKMGIKKLVSSQDLQKYTPHAVLAVMWAPCLAFVVAGWITARFSPGRTIAEPAIGAVLSVAVLFVVALLRPGPVDAALGPVRIDLTHGAALQINLFFLAMFNAAMLACAGAYFGEVSQSRAVILSGKN
ncbi:MAG: hypothetical protein HYY17_04725 [Planctomycetes bacterium]|nr:hypothetical protein [Planctomycetota bacterium]